MMPDDATIERMAEAMDSVTIQEFGELDLAESDHKWHLVLADAAISAYEAARPTTGPYSRAETCVSCGHQSFWHGAGAPRCSFMVAGHEACACHDLRFARPTEPDPATIERMAEAMWLLPEGRDSWYELAVAAYEAEHTTASAEVARISFEDGSDTVTGGNTPDDPIAMRDASWMDGYHEGIRQERERNTAPADASEEARTEAMYAWGLRYKPHSITESFAGFEAGWDAAHRLLDYREARYAAVVLAAETVLPVPKEKN